MNHKIISYSFVGIWEKPILKIPLLEKKFCMDLFGDPYNTDSGMSQEGFVITYQGKNNPSPMVLISPQRFMVITQELDSTIGVIEKVKNELSRVTSNKFPFKLKACGINTEHEWSGLEEKASHWLSKRFVLNGLNIAKDQEKIKVLTTDINFQLLLEENQKMVILMQPRASVPDGIFLSINHHMDEIFEQMPNKTKLEGLFKKSVQKVETDIFNLVLK